jgi:hypothetical protein
MSFLKMFTRKRSPKPDINKLSVSEILSLGPKINISQKEIDLIDDKLKQKVLTIVMAVNKLERNLKTPNSNSRNIIIKNLLISKGIMKSKEVDDIIAKKTKEVEEEEILSKRIDALSSSQKSSRRGGKSRTLKKKS